MLYGILLLLLLIYTGQPCEIWKASECPAGPTQEEEDLIKSETYTKEQLFAFCDRGKTYADCINERLHCCDMRVEYATALVSLDAQLKRNAWRTEKYCAGISESTSMQYRCLTTLGTLITTTERPTTTPTPICDMEKTGRECSPILDNHVHFDEQWSIYEKAKWCKDAYDYSMCVLAHITNCIPIPVARDIAQLTVFLNFIEKSANRECPGGLYGCAINAESDIRCRAGAKYFLERNALTAHAIERKLSSLTLLVTYSFTLIIQSH